MNNRKFEWRKQEKIFIINKLTLHHSWKHPQDGQGWAQMLAENVYSATSPIEYSEIDKIIEINYIFITWKKDCFLISLAFASP